MERLEEIERDQREYTLDEDDRKLQVAISENDVIVLKKSISCSYPNLPFNKALQKEQEKLQAELQQSQANMDVSQCEVIERLMEVTEIAASSVKEKDSPQKVSIVSASDKEQFSNEKKTRKGDTSRSSREVAVSSGHNMKSTKEAYWPDEWHADLLGCCSEPYLCAKTLICPCDTISKIASVANSKEISSAEACNEIMAYSLVLSCCCYTCCIRRKLRRTLNIKGGWLDDFLSHFMCCCCALVQECREVEIRGVRKTSTMAPAFQEMEY